MKWRPNNDNSAQKEIADAKFMLSNSNEQSETITGHKFSPTTATYDETKPNQKYKPRNSGDVLADQLKMQQSHQPHQTSQTLYRNHRDSHPPRHYKQRRKSLEEAYNISSNNYNNSSSNDLNSSSVYIISNSNEIVQPNNPPTWITGKSLPSTMNAATSTTVTSIANYPTTGAPPSSSSINNKDEIMNSHHNSNNYNNLANDATTNTQYHYATAQSSPAKNLSSNGSFNTKNSSTAKLLPVGDDQSSTQTKCSVFRGLVLCICLNITYANVVRFPRELDRFGSAYLIPYLVLLFLVGLPIILLEISIGQFLGQGAAHTWRSSPIFKGACIVSRFASWLASIWVSLQAVLAVVYIGMFLYKIPPFNGCVGDIKLAENGYKVLGTNGQDCIQKTFLTPLWDNPLYFGMVALALIFLWIIVMLSTHNAKVFRRITFFFGLIGFTMLCLLTGWEVHQSLESQYFPELWPFDEKLLMTSGIWFNALVQVIYSTNIGFGALPVITGKFLYKGDAVRTSVVYLCFNLLINAIAVTLFMVQFDNLETRNSSNPLEELKPLTAIYDRIIHDPDTILKKLIPVLVYALIVISAIVSITIAIYTSSRLIPRHPNYILSLVALVMAIGTLVAPKFSIPSILDTRIVGTLVIAALIFDLIATTWVYGAKNIYTDLEFSIGRPILKSWLFLWCFAPIALIGILGWWCVDDDRHDLMFEFIPRWAPIIFVLIVNLIIACVEIFKQVDYNFFGMICEAAKSAKEWGPADPLARHAWKQWRSVCQDTGRKDFTLRRRGTRDYTHSIKKGQYSTASKYATQNWKSSSTPGSSSPNYSGSVFGDSAIEEDMSVDKYSGINNQFVPFESNDKPLRYSSGRSRQTTNDKRNNFSSQEKHKEVVYIRRLSNDNTNHATRIEITPSNESITYGSKNPLGRTSTLSKDYKSNMSNEKDGAQLKLSNGSSTGTQYNGNDICWKKISINADEYSTEL